MKTQADLDRDRRALRQARRLNGAQQASMRTLKRLRPRTPSGKTWRVLAKQRGTHRDIGDGTLRGGRPKARP